MLILTNSNDIFHKWAIGYVKIKDKEWVSIDGKAIGSTVGLNKPDFQKFVSLVSVFASKRRQVLSAGKILSHKESEIPKVKELIASLDLKGVVFTMDALHCQKETVKTITTTNNDYCIGVKGNQRKLRNRIKKNVSENKPISVHKTVEKNRNRTETRETEVYGDLSGIEGWDNLGSIIHIQRKVKYMNKNIDREEDAYFISSLPPSTTAQEFNEGIRSHWSIENSLHYVKDKTFNEDSSRITAGSAPENRSILVNMVLNIFRKHKYENIAQAMRIVSHNIPLLWKMIRE